jgi:hypothetical protein
MSQPLELAITQIVSVISAVPGIKQVPLNPPETINVPTFGLVYAEEGYVGIGQVGQVSLGSVGNRAAFHNISIDILTVRTDLAINLAFMKPFIDLVPEAILRECAPDGGMFGGTVTSFGMISYRWVNPKYAGVQMTGYHFVINQVKILINSS